MKIKQYVVKNLQEALLLIDQDLGKDAMIINKQWIRQPGLFGYFKQKQLEVTAAIETLAKEEYGFKNDWLDEVMWMKPMPKKPDTILQSVPMKDLSGYEFCQSFKEAYEQSQEEHLADFVKQEVSRLVTIGTRPRVKIHVFVGPPGVGKTTTIAKIASNEMIYHQRKIGFITVDTYRIGAVEQLKTYASILNAPLRVVHNQTEMIQALDELKDCHQIIVDSVGRTHRDQENLFELKTLFEPLIDYNCYLVLSMSTQARQLKKIMKQYELLEYNHLILTKLDECERNENILNICYEHSYPIAYLCTGQEVPSDIESPSLNRIMDLILGGETDE